MIDLATKHPTASSQIIRADLDISGGTAGKSAPSVQPSSSPQSLSADKQHPLLAIQSIDAENLDHLYPSSPTQPFQALPIQDAENLQSMGLKKREQLIDSLRKQVFSLKLRIFYLTENLVKVSPGQVDILDHKELKAAIKHHFDQQSEPLITKLEAQAVELKAQMVERDEIQTFLADELLATTDVLEQVRKEYTDYAEEQSLRNRHMQMV